MVIGFIIRDRDKECSNYARLRKPEYVSKSLIQMWVLSYKTNEEGEDYCELSTQNEPFYIVSDDDDGGLASYRMHSVAHTIMPDEVNEVEGQKQEGVISRVFKNQRPEMSPDISCYSLQEYPHRDFALSCGIRSSLCVPIYQDIFSYESPGGVLEFVSTSTDQLKSFRNYCRYYEAFVFRGTKMNLMIDQLYCDPRRHYLRRNVEMDHLLTVVCQKYPLPLAQYWEVGDVNVRDLGVVNQEGNIDFPNVTPWLQFKNACKNIGLYIDEGLVGKSYLSHKSFLCRDIKELSITNYPLAHYAPNCRPIPCFTICLCSFKPWYREYVLELFLPSQEMDSYDPRTLLNSLMETMKEHLPDYMVASGEQLGQVLSVEVIKSSTHDKPEYLKIGEPQSSLPPQEGLNNEGDASHQFPFVLPSLFKDGAVQDGNVMNIEESNSTINSYEEIASGETSTSRPNIVPETIHADESVQESPLENIAYALTNEDVNYALNNKEDMNLENVSKHFGRPLNDAAKSFGVSRSTFKRICRGLGIKRWQSGKRRMKGNFSSRLGKGINQEQPGRRNFGSTSMAAVNETVVAHSSQDLNKMTVKATYKDVTIRFKLPDLSGIAELENNVIERLHLGRNNFTIKYQDEEGDLVLIACDKDVRECIEISRSLKETTIKLLLDPPLNRNAL
ncbi:protein NLP7 isoform X1 [Daucus carota subsp. sativus]|uniref:PB1 domain-containing protein n=1 Tax=Daucus carota subsp. sativus TaxID=79200 RepID=A0A175YJP1_DAUCS|nr:PREDICTED: protein NLP7-like isoform X1 [Daucus carota subsp. sativus]